MKFNNVLDFVSTQFEQSILPQIADYIRIPNLSPAFDPDWEAHGHMDRAAELLAGWCRAQPIPGLSVEIIREPGRTPLIFCEIPGTAPGTVLLYGHLDKQPEFTGWTEGLGPWEPVLRDGRLYGRGGADDGYAVFSSLTALRVLHEQGLPHARCVVLIEGCEESGSQDLPYYVDALAARIGTPDLVVCLDAECGNYDQLWCTTSLRGNLTGTLSVEVLTEGIHSGLGTGIAPAAFRIARTLLARLENDVTGDLLVDELYAEIPTERQAQARAAALVLGERVSSRLPFVAGVSPVSDSPFELLLNNTWRPTLAVTGAAGLPELRQAGNVLLPRVELKLSLRLPPGVDASRATDAVRTRLEADPPYGARIRFKVDASLAGWNAPPLAPWLAAAMDAASRGAFGRPVMYQGTGGSIPFIGMLQEKFPATQFLVTGVLGPHANAHGPNEFLHIGCAQKLTACVAQVLAEHAASLTAAPADSARWLR
ncbi:MAG: M20/M25/M40 family metallo-hydrolase [Gammaproteobacteria bacterium]|nr:M20/M25/M40 family metallo-hydrolase [Gammaproteobacteria bacterium]